jgi:hypothetical protein
VVVSSTPTNVTEEIVRIDHQFNSKNTIFGHFVAEQISQGFGTTMWSGDNVPTIGNSFGNPSYSAVATWTRTISPTLLNELTFNYSGNRLNIIGLRLRSLYPNPNEKVTQLSGGEIDLLDELDDLGRVTCDEVCVDRPGKIALETDERAIDRGGSESEGGLQERPIGRERRRRDRTRGKGHRCLLCSLFRPVLATVLALPSLLAPRDEVAQGTDIVAHSRRTKVFALAYLLSESIERLLARRRE